MNIAFNVQKLLLSNNNYIAYSKINSKTQNELPGIIFFSGFNSNMQGTKARNLTEYCQNNNYNFIKFDYLGHGLSSGIFHECTIGIWLENCLSIIDNLTTDKHIFIGSSMGGWLALLASILRPEKVAGIICIAAAPDFTENLIWNTLSLEEKNKLQTQGIIKLSSNYCEGEYEISLKLIEEAREHLILNKPLDIKCPIYLLHGMADKDVPYNFSLDLVNSISSQDITVKLVKDAGHGMSTKVNLYLLYNTINELITKITNK
ncbi:acyl-CoA esterase [Rickettsiales bacterium Ac37b]|nr:acyl-CoA esterase [Rickettsiales bacterium Ac37b]